MKIRRAYWVIFFILFVLIVAGLWTTSNVYFYQKYSALVDQMRGFMSREKLADFREPLVWMTVFLSLGFGVGLLGLGVFFVRLLREMRLSQMQKEFLARISHELQSPVSSLELSSSMLRSKDNQLSRAEIESLWDVHDSELKRLRVEIESLLESSRWEHRGFSAQVQPVNFEEWLQSAFVGWEKIIGPAGQISRSGEMLQFRTSMDPRMMLLITNNLVDNARKFSKAGGLQLKIKTRTETRADGVIKWFLEFCDNGSGFAPEYSKKIFKKFEKDPTKSLKSGYGFGLFIVKEACKELGFEIKASSQGSNTGATFTISGHSELEYL